MENLLSDLEMWFKTRPMWLREATRQLISRSFDGEISRFVQMCKEQAKGDLEAAESLRDSSVSLGTLVEADDARRLKLISISNVVGINALAPRDPLVFEPTGLTIVYGPNGSGKSGYTRILKHASGSGGPGTLHDNVFTPSSENQGCTFTYELDGEETHNVNWSVRDGCIVPLNNVAIFDTECANLYITKENEIAYEPALLRLFTRLVEISDKVNTALQEEVVKVTPLLPKFPEKLLVTKAGTWYSTLSYKTTDDAIKEHCTWSEEDATSLAILKEQLAEKSPAEKAQAAKQAKSQVDALRGILSDLHYSLSSAHVVEIQSARATAASAWKTVREDANQVFSGAPLNGIGTESWQRLWQAARAFSEEVAYPGIAFPKTDERAYCVLCQQPLSVEAGKRLDSFEQYVRGALRETACAADRSVEKLEVQVTTCPTEQEITVWLDAAQIKDETTRTLVLTSFAALRLRLDAILDREYSGTLPDLPSEMALSHLREFSEQFKLAEKSWLRVSNNNRATLENDARELEARQWLFDQREMVVQAVVSFRLQAELEQARKLTNTHDLSAKKSAITKAIITDAYLQRFQAEIEQLGAKRLHVRLAETKPTKGHVYFRLQIDNSKNGIPVHEILSEGELRIISLAAFLADWTGRSGSYPFIFDDPISSLDQDYEEATVKRLLHLAETRQVIIFTHRLSLLSMLDNPTESIAPSKRVIGLSRGDREVGQPGKVPLRHESPKSALGTLLSERLPAARLKLSTEGPASYEIYAKAICSDLRISVERLVEKILLADVVGRFRPEIKTNNMLDKLAKISRKDCVFLESMMSKYSRYEHPQPDETPLDLPDPEEISADIRALQQWVKEFEARKCPEY